MTHDGWVAVSSEAGSFQVPDENVDYRGRLRPGSMFAIDLAQGRVLDEGEAERVVANSRPVGRVGRGARDPALRPAAGGRRTV